MRGFPFILLIGVALLAGLAGGCKSGANNRDQLRSSYPLARAQAAVALAEAGDAKAVYALVDLLEDLDSGVRMYAQLALERLTQKNYGYHYYDDDAVRGAAVERWRAALRKGEVVVVRSAGRTD